MMKETDRDAGEAGPTKVPPDSEQIVQKVRERYGRLVSGSGVDSSCCGTACCSSEKAVSESIGYRQTDLARLPEGADLGLGCGAPIDHLQLKEGEVVLDLGSGGGLDAFLAAQRVGERGRVIGVDMTPEMIERARAAAKRAGLTHVEFRQGRLENLPVEDDSVDAVTSNCVINLVPDKASVFREVARVLRPGGRLVVSDIVLNGELPGPIQQDLLAYVGCVAGAMQRETYFGMLRDAGLTGVEILSEIDYLAKVGSALPDEVLQLVKRTGIQLDQFRGKVRSVTYRARMDG